MTLGQRLADGPLISMRLQAALAQTGSTPVFLAGTDANDPEGKPEVRWHASLEHPRLVQRIRELLKAQ